MTEGKISDVVWICIYGFIYYCAPADFSLRMITLPLAAAHIASLRREAQKYVFEQREEWWSQYWPPRALTLFGFCLIYFAAVTFTGLVPTAGAVEIIGDSSRIPRIAVARAGGIDVLTPDQYMRRRDANKKIWIESFIPEPLTSDQQDAVFAICNKEHEDLPFVVHGSPGTGKTCTNVASIEVLLQMNSTNRVLVCTSSNMTADRVAEKLMSKSGAVLTARNVLRLRFTGTDYANRDRQFDSITSRDLVYEQFSIPKNFAPYRVVVCTLGCSSHLMRVGVDREICLPSAGQAGN